MTLDLWLEYLIRFSHLVAGIAWIGSSFYFIWMDSAFAPPETPRRNVDGELFMVHGGFYYQVEKRKIYPGELPKVLHWFKWEATLTWITGFLLFFVLYYANGASLLIGSNGFTQGQAIGTSLGILVASWFVYDLIWHPRWASFKPISRALSVVFFPGLILLLTHLYSGRGAFILTGACLGNMMLLNVWIRILPGQRKMLADATAGKVPDYSLGLRSKTRSVHNTYFIFPVLFIMLSNHYPTLYAHPQNAWLLMALALAGALTRHAMVTQKPVERWTLAPAAVLLLGLVYFTAFAPKALSSTNSAEVSYSQVHAVLQSRCLSCHAAHPTDDTYKEAPKGSVFETEAQVRTHAAKIHLFAVQAKIMPLANKTGMTDEERSVLDTWIRREGLVPNP